MKGNAIVKGSDFQQYGNVSIEGGAPKSHEILHKLGLTPIETHKIVKETEPHRNVSRYFDFK